MVSLKRRKVMVMLIKMGFYWRPLLTKKKINERMILTRMLVVIGRYILKLPRSMTMSPGSLPKKGSLGKKCVIIPASSINIPAIIRNFPIFKIIKQPADA